MKRTWTIIGVRDVPGSFHWYQSLFGQPETSPAHADFGEILDSDGTVLLCLHEWGAHEHPSLGSYLGVDRLPRPRPHSSRAALCQPRHGSIGGRSPRGVGVAASRSRSRASFAIAKTATRAASSKARPHTP
jgi:hypothetical protein